MSQEQVISETEITLEKANSLLKDLADWEIESDQDEQANSFDFLILERNSFRRIAKIKAIKFQGLIPVFDLLSIIEHYGKFHRELGRETERNRIEIAFSQIVNT